MGRPGAGGGGVKVGSSMGSVHKVNTGSTGSMHRVGGSISRPSIASTSSRPKTTAAVTSNKSGFNNVSKVNRPAMDSTRNMVGGYGNTKRNEDVKPKQEMRQQIRREEVPTRRMAPPPPQRVTRPVPPPPSVTRPVPPPPHREPEVRPHREEFYEKPMGSYSRTPVSHTTVVHNTYVNTDSRYERMGSQKSVETFDSQSNASPDGMNDQRCKEPEKMVEHKVPDKIESDFKNRVSRYIAVLAFALICFVICVILTGMCGSKKQSTAVNRTKLDTKRAYINDCVNDELEWVNANAVSKGLMKFYEDTGAQPAIWLRKYDGVDLSDDQEYNVATEYYDTVYADRQDVVLFVYFEESDPDIIGNMVLLHGTESGTIMDAEAENIFWNYLDYAWNNYSAEETDDMFIYVFTKTANSIMYHSTTGWDVLYAMFILFTVAAAITAVIEMFFIVRLRSKEKAAETERILKSNMGDLVDSKSDELLNKYK